MPRSRYRFPGNDAPYFMTMTVNCWLPIFLELLALSKQAHKTQSVHQLWEEGSHPQRIESDAVMR